MKYFYELMTELEHQYWVLMSVKDCKWVLLKTEHGIFSQKLKQI